MTSTNLILENKGEILTATINRVEYRNSVNPQLLSDFHLALDQAEADSNCRALVIQGKDGLFCTGMDFQNLTKSVNEGKNEHISANEYMSLLKRFTLSPKFIISKIDGRVLAGGVGIAAASDIVLATNKTQFGLSEAMWGLLPANVMPFLIRRIGFQPAYIMTLTTRDITAQKAYELHLVDELNDDLDDSLRKLMINLRRVASRTVVEAKQFFREMWIINETMEKTAIDELEKLIAQPETINNITNYIQHKKFPWEQ